MIIVCPTVPHTGTHFMRELFATDDRCEAIIVHPYPDQVPELEKLIDDGNPVVIPQRPIDQVRASWWKYGKDPELGFAGRPLEQWLDVQYGLAERGITYYLALEMPGIREIQLAEINKDLDLNLVTDWKPRRQPGADELAAVGKMLDEKELPAAVRREHE